LVRGVLLKACSTASHGCSSTGSYSNMHCPCFWTPRACCQNYTMPASV
jgi:hypothetical protein